MRRIGFAMLVLLLVTACGSGGGDRSTTSSAAGSPPDFLAACATSGQDWRPVSGAGVAAAALGSGPTVVFGNESGDDPCPWPPIAGTLAKAGYRVVVFEYGGAAETQSVKDMLALATAAGAGKYALVGASVGGRIVIEAAGTRPAGLAAIVSLSGERALPGYPDIIGSARRVVTPTLYVGTKTDSYTEGVTQQNQLHAAMHGQPNTLVQLDGGAHGTDMFDLPTPGGQTVTERIVSFVKAELPT